MGLNPFEMEGAHPLSCSMNDGVNSSGWGQATAALLHVVKVKGFAQPARVKAVIDRVRVVQVWRALQ
jgi:hypothetical protein